VLSALDLGFERLDTLRNPFRAGNQIVAAPVEKKLVREMAVGSGDSSCLDFHVDAPQMFAATLGFTLLPVKTGTRLGNDIHLVDVA
jgi:hypothetical protein